MDVQRQWFGDQLIVAGRRITPIRVRIKSLDELYGGGVGSIARPRHIVAFDQIRIEGNLLVHHLSLGHEIYH